MLTLLTILLALALIIIAIIRFEIHPFLALFVGAILYGLLVGMPPSLIIKSIEDGFGGVVGRIGLVIMLGVIIGTFLEKTGGALVIAQKILSWIGEKSVMLAMMITGWFMSIPVFADSAFVMIHPVNKSLSYKSKVSFAATTVALSLGLISTHCLVPPTPGPIAAAGILGADLGLVIVWGLIVSALALIPCFFFVKYYVSRFPLEARMAPDAAATETKHRLPSAGKSSLPILIPLLLIILASIANYPTHPFGENAFSATIDFLGNPIMALLIGTFLSFTLPEKFDRKLLSSTGWIGESLVIAAPIILITAAGGVFGKMLQNSGVGDLVTANINVATWGVFLPFAISMVLKTAQGSSTVAMITTASIVVPLLPALGLSSEMSLVFATLAIGAGATALSHANDSFFWVITQMTGMNIKVGNQTHTFGTLVLGLSAIGVIWVMAIISDR